MTIARHRGTARRERVLPIAYHTQNGAAMALSRKAFAPSRSWPAPSYPGRDGHAVIVGSWMGRDRACVSVSVRAIARWVACAACACVWVHSETSWA